MSNDPDRDAALLASLEAMTKEEIAERIQTLEDGLHDAKSFARDLRGHLDEAAREITRALEGLNKNLPEDAYNATAKSFAAIAIANRAAKLVAA